MALAEFGRPHELCRLWRKFNLYFGPSQFTHFDLFPVTNTVHPSRQQKSVKMAPAATGAKKQKKKWSKGKGKLPP